MAYGNATAVHDTRSKITQPISPRVIVTGTTIYAGSIVVAVAGTGLVFAPTGDTATHILAGVAMSSTFTAALVVGAGVAGDTIDVAGPGNWHWLKTVDATVDATKLDQPVYVDYGATGTPQHVTTATVPTNQLGMVGVIRGWATGLYLVDTTQMGMIVTDASLNYEIT